MPTIYLFSTLFACIVVPQFRLGGMGSFVLFSIATLADMRYSADLTAGALKLSQSRTVARLLLEGLGGRDWKDVILKENVLQASNPSTAIRLARLIRQRLETMQTDLWRLISDGTAVVATHAVLAAAIKHSPLLGDFLDLAVRDQFRLFNPDLTGAIWDDYLEGCRGRDPEMPLWHESTRRRLRSSVFQSLAQAGFLADTKSLKLQPVHVPRQVIAYLQAHDEVYVLRCMEVCP